jgi:hydroxymethylpyrimidine/phosphomethylpyrimidine kinase
MKTVLTIAGSDSSGGAGVQADIKTITAHKLYASSVITALTAQNTAGVFAILDIGPDFVSKQIDAVFSDIYPDAVKIGMVSNAEIIETIADKLKFYGAKNIVLDPVMVSTSGSKLLSPGAISSLINKLMPLADIITPNLLEACCLCGYDIKSEEDVIKAAEDISQTVKGAILIKGGHFGGGADDLLYMDKKPYWFRSPRINNPNTHGTGCTLSSAIACNLAMGCNMRSSVKNAKDYITGALKAGLDLGKGSGPLNHCWNIKP